MIRLTILSALVLFTALACNPGHKAYTPQGKLDAFEQQRFVYSIIRYAGPLAPRATRETKFDAEFDGAYWQTAASHRLDWYYEHPRDGYIYFGISRVAPSIHQKRVTIGGRLKKDDAQITYYEEMFRTWRMEEEELTRKSAFLFARMVSGRDLTPYYPEQSGAEEYIEFPNATTRFDTGTRRWISSLENPAEELRNHIRQTAAD